MTDTVFLVIVCVFGAGLSLGFVLGRTGAPPAPVSQPRSYPPLKTSVAPARPAERPAAPLPPIWEEDPFFARPETLGEPREGDGGDEVEHSVAGNVIALRGVLQMG